MMKRIVCLFALFIFTVSMTVVCAQGNKKSKNTDIPPGMEIIEVGNTSQMVPQGTRVIKEGGRRTIESTRRYMARRFFEMDARLKKLERENDELKKEVRKLEALLKQNK